MFPKKITSHIRYFVLKTNNFSFINKVYLLFYKISLIFIVRGLNKLKGIKAICLEGSLIQKRSKLKAGSTDIDLIILTEELSPKGELKFLYAFVNKCINFKKIFPFFKDYSPLNKSTAQIHTYAKILGPYHFKKYSLLYKVISGKSVNNPSLKKLKFSLESDPATDFFILMRTTLKPINEDIYNAATNNKVYARNSIISIKRIIDYINQHLPGIRDKSSPRELKEKIEFISNKNFFIYPKDYPFFISIINDLYKLFEECLEYLLIYIHPTDTAIRSNTVMTRNNFPNETLPQVVSELQGKLTRTYRDMGEPLYNISILPDYNCNHNYSIYIILNGGFKPQVIKETYKIIKEITLLKTNSFNYCSCPIIITKRLFEINKEYLKSYCGPLDILLFNRHLYNIAGEALNKDLDKTTMHNFINAKLYGNISKIDYNYLIESQNTFEQLMEHLQNKNMLGVRKTTDYLLGATTSHRLAVEKGTITGTPLESFTEYINHYGNERLTNWYKDFYHKFYDIRIPCSFQFINSQIKGLFYFHKRNNAITSDIVNSNLKDHFESYKD